MTYVDRGHWSVRQPLAEDISEDVLDFYPA